MNATTYRLTYAKGPALRHLGHLDTTRLWQRLLRRARLPLAFTAGYHPRPKLAMAPPLSLGFTSRTEVLDVSLCEARPPGRVRDALALVLAPGLELRDVRTVTPTTPKLSTIETLSYTATLPPDAEPRDAATLAARAAALLAADTLPVPRERHGCTRTFDVRPSLRALAVTGDPPTVRMTVAVRQTGTANPREVLALLGGWDAGTIREAAIERCTLTFASTPSQGFNGYQTQDDPKD